MNTFGQPHEQLPAPSPWRPPFTITQPDREVDPVTYEIVRHRLWYAGMTIGETLKKVSGTIVVSEAQDMSTYITLPDSAPIFLGPYILLHSGLASILIDHVTRAVSTDGKIKPGDMYFVNDPWMGLAHQADCAVVSPFFVGKELVAWCGVTLHQLDMGGVDPGGVCPHARDAYAEPSIFPAVKIVERGRLRSDIDRLLQRNSRMPDILALDVRSMIAANHAAQRDLQEIVERYGLDTVQAVMQHMLWDSHTAFGDRLRELPRGTFRARDYFEIGGYAPELIDSIYEMHVTLTNDGERLSIDFSGTSPQSDSFVNCGFGGLLGGIVGVLLQQLAFDIPWNGGIFSHLEVITQEGTINNPTWPAAVSGGITEGCIVTLTVVGRALAGLLAGAPSIRDHVLAPGGSIFLGSTLGGQTAEGEFWGTLIMDPIGMGGGASASVDGLDLCGSSVIPYTQYANVESTEMNYPLLYLFRRVAKDAFGFGRYRGGQSLEFAIKVHGVPMAMLMTWTHGAEFPNVQGLFGAGPSAAARFLLARGAELETWWERQELPVELDAFPFEALPAKVETFLGPDDVLLFGVPGGAGVGDPLERDPAAVAEDVRVGRLCADRAEAFMGVMLTANGEADVQATVALREDMRGQRRAQATPPDGAGLDAVLGDEAVRVGHGLTIWATDNGYVWACESCSYQYAPADANPREAAAVREASIIEVGHPMGQQVRLDRPRFMLREFFCPRCALRFATEVARPDTDPPLFEVEYDPAWLKEQTNGHR